MNSQSCVSLGFLCFIYLLFQLLSLYFLTEFQFVFLWFHTDFRFLHSVSSFKWISIWGYGGCLFIHLCLCACDAESSIQICLFQHRYLMIEGIINVSNLILFFSKHSLAMNLLLTELHNMIYVIISCLVFLENLSFNTSVTICLVFLALNLHVPSRQETKNTFV